jgi:hypothetical protein
VQSTVVQLEQLAVMNVVNDYEEDFSFSSGLWLNGFKTGTLFQHSCLQSSHNYSDNKRLDAFLLHPVKVSDMTNVLYTDIAVLEPGNAGDSVSFEATSNGIDWVTISSYSSEFYAKWYAAFSSGAEATSDMYVNHTFKLRDFFERGDSVLFRICVQSNSSVNGWGYACKDFVVLEAPLSTSESSPLLDVMSVFPNPTTGTVWVKLHLDSPCHGRIDITRENSEVVESIESVFMSGAYDFSTKFQHQPAGIYIMHFFDGRRTYSRKVVKL